MRDFHQPGRSAVLASNGICATSHPLAARTAIDILARGGNAMDAAIAGAVLLGFCEPQMTGIGGDCFVLFTDPGATNVKALNGSGRAPAAASAQALRDDGHNTVPVYSPHAVTTPCAIESFCRLSEDHGKLGLDALLAPSIRYADEGVPVAPRVALDWPEDAKVLQGHGVTHFSNGGKILKTGDLFRAPGQAEVLRRIAKNGASAFYEGEVANDMLAALTALGGVHTTEDFANRSVDYTTPISGTYKGTDLIEHPPNGQGATAILLLNILAHFDIAAMDPFGAQRAHIEAEASKLAYDARDRILGDPDTTARLEHMLSPETAARLAALIDPKKAMPDPAPVAEAVHKDTVYITVIDRDRMAVSLIYSIFHGFGSGIASEKFGILLQNRGAGFNLTPGHVNELVPGKRPLHTIIPAMLGQNDQVSTSFGVMGGAYQPCGHARFMSNMLDFGMDPQSANDAPRCFAESEGLKIERGYSDATRQALADMGHNLITPHEPIGGAQSITIRENGVLEGSSDPRKDGCALGY
ncbi:gamma-glutamyltransferase [Roseovarius sp. 2305UL8-3]|uniref:gamma-glutamyltransferase n=1 Tax=Roseovarius conchicola TaxID=3121636 RepID=UPI003527BD60